MKLSEAIERAERDRPGEATRAEILKWLTELEDKWRLEVLDTHFPNPWWEQRRIICPRPVDLMSTQSGILGFSILNRDVYLMPVKDFETPVREPVRVPCFRKDLKRYAGALRVDVNVEGFPRSELRVVCAAGTEELTVEQYLSGTGAEITAEDDGKIWINWGTETWEGEGCVEIGFLLYSESETYNIRIWRYSNDETTPSGGGEGTLDVLSRADRDPELIIPSPDDEVYIHWLYAKIDQRLGEIDRYNNDAMLFNAGWLEAAKRFNRSNRPKGFQRRGVVYGRPPVWIGDEDPLNQRRHPRW